MKLEPASQSNVVEVWYADDRPREVVRFFTALIQNWPSSDPYSLVTRFVFPRHEFSDKSVDPIDPLQIDFESFHGWNLLPGDKNWIITRSATTDVEIEIHCHNFWFHYKFQVNKHLYSTEQFIKEPKLRMVIGRDSDVLLKGVEILRRYIYEESRLIVFASDLRWGNETLGEIYDYSGVLLLTALAEDLPLPLMPRFGISSFLQGNTAEAQKLRQEKIAIILDKNQSDSFLSEDGWRWFFNEGPLNFLTRLAKPLEWLTEKFEETKDVLRAEPNQATEFFIGALEKSLGQHTRSTILEDIAQSHGLNRRTAVRPLAVTKEWGQATKAEIYTALREMAKRWTIIADINSDRFDDVAGFYFYDACARKCSDEPDDRESICRLLNITNSRSIEKTLRDKESRLKDPEIQRSLPARKRRRNNKGVTRTTEELLSSSTRNEENRNE